MYLVTNVNTGGNAQIDYGGGFLVKDSSYVYMFSCGTIYFFEVVSSGNAAIASIIDLAKLTITNSGAGFAGKVYAPDGFFPRKYSKLN